MMKDFKILPYSSGGRRHRRELKKNEPHFGAHFPQGKKVVLNIHHEERPRHRFHNLPPHVIGTSICPGEDNPQGHRQHPDVILLSVTRVPLSVLYFHNITIRLHHRRSSHDDDDDDNVSFCIW
jgi:hypothetical protein